MAIKGWSPGTPGGACPHPMVVTTDRLMSRPSCRLPARALAREACSVASSGSAWNPSRSTQWVDGDALIIKPVTLARFEDA